MVMRARLETRKESGTKVGKLLSKSIKEVLKRYKNVLTNGSSQALPLRRKVDHKI